jgi:hypothetical protein
MSPAQRAANLANAQKSTGPRTPEGKARSSRNARKHGFTATTFPIFRFEDSQDVTDLHADLTALYRPRNARESFALERMALAQHTMLRAYRLESGLFARAMNEVIEHADRLPLLSDPIADDIEITRQQNRNILLAEGFIDMHR